MPDERAANPLWRFSITTYARPGASEACLALQDESGADVNLVLYLLWLGVQGKPMTPEQVRDIIDSVEAWRRDVVASLRQARRAAKEPPVGFDRKAVAELRETIKRAELESERLQQEVLFHLPLGGQAGLAQPSEAVRSNLDAYETVLGREFPEEARRKLIDAALATGANGVSNE